MHEARLAMARAAGIAPESLPFVAELLDVLPAEEQWRTAIESVLAPVARTLLVDADQLSAFSAAIDSLQLPVRVQFEGVPTGPHLDLDGDPAMVSGKLAVKDSPFSTWVRETHRVRPDRRPVRRIGRRARRRGSSGDAVGPAPRRASRRAR